MKRILIVFAALLFTASAHAQDGKWWKRPRIAQALGLTAQQTAELEKIFAKSRPRIIDLKADLEKKQFAYQEAMTSEKVDRKEVAALIEAREQARAQLQKELSLMELDMRQVLTPSSGKRPKRSGRSCASGCRIGVGRCATPRPKTRRRLTPSPPAQRASPQPAAESLSGNYCAAPASIDQRSGSSPPCACLRSAPTAVAPCPCAAAAPARPLRR